MKVKTISIIHRMILLLAVTHVDLAATGKLDIVFPLQLSVLLIRLNPFANNLVVSLAWPGAIGFIRELVSA